MEVILGSMTYSVGPKGQVVIPKPFRDALRIHPGQEIVFEQRGDELILRKSSGAPLKGRFQGSNLTDALLVERETERSRDDRRA